MRVPSALLAVFVFLAPAAAADPPTEAAFRTSRNLVANPSFEADWTHNAVTVTTRFHLLEQSDWGYAQADGLPDAWVVPPTAALDPTTARFGRGSLRLTSGTASQVVYVCGETDPRDGGSHYNAFRPLPPELLKAVQSRPLKVGVWCKTRDAGTEPTLAVVAEAAAGDGTPTAAKPVTAKFAKGTHDWEYGEVVIPPPGAGVLHAAVVRLTFPGPGVAWFDGVTAEEVGEPDGPNLLPNGGFEAAGTDLPAGWAGPVLWTWTRRHYYRFTGWSHEKGATRGGAAVVPMGYAGGRSLQLTVLPGDNLAVKSDPVLRGYARSRNQACIVQKT